MNTHRTKIKRKSHSSVKHAKKLSMFNILMEFIIANKLQQNAKTRFITKPVTQRICHLIFLSLEALIGAKKENGVNTSI